MILYYFLNNKPINGSLFYCFEYFIFLNDYKDTEFWIYGIAEKQLNNIKQIFINKYDFEINLLNKIKCCKIKDFTKKFSKVIILDNNTYNNLRGFLKSKVLLHNTNNKSLKNKNIDDIVFGSYYYQNRDVKQHLQFHFKIFKKLINVKDNIFISFPERTLEQSLKYLKSKNILVHKKTFIKNNKHTFNLFENFNTFVYIHNIFDTNNRLIVESFYYDKKIIIFDDFKKDSINIRYKELNNKGIDYFKLTLNNKLIKEYIDN